MRSFLGIFASIPFVLTIPGMIVAMAFSRTYFDADVFKTKVVPDSYNSATLLVSEHFAGADRELTGVLVDRVRALITEDEYAGVVGDLFSSAQKTFNVVDQNLAEDITFDLSQIKTRLLALADNAPNRVQSCSDLEITRNVTVFCIPRQFSTDDSKEKMRTMFRKLIEKEIPDKYVFTPKPGDTDAVSQNVEFEKMKQQFHEFTVNAYLIHQGLAIGLFVSLLVFCFVQGLIQFSISRLLYFVGGLLVTVSAITSFIASNLQQLPTYIGMNGQLSYAQQHLIRFTLMEPQPLLRNMGFAMLISGIIVVMCGVLYARVKKSRREEVTV